MTYASSSSTFSRSSTGPSSSTSRSPSVEPSTSKLHQRRLTLQDIHIPAGFEIAKHIEASDSEYPSEENIQKAAEVLQSLRGRMPDGSDGQVAACDYCRRRKIRCDRIKPTCGSCVSTGRKCTTEDMLRKRGPPSKKERAILEAAGIIFRGTRPHRRRRTATTFLGSGAASKQQADVIRKVKEAAGTRTRANSTNSGETAAESVAFGVTALAEMGSGSKSSWMEMLSVATQAENPFADSPASSPSDISGSDTFHIDAGACDYILPGISGVDVNPVPARTALDNLHNTMGSGWDSVWAPSFGAKHAPGGSFALLPLELPNLTAFACNSADAGLKQEWPRSPLSSFDAGALDWSHSSISPSQYQMLYPPAAGHHAIHPTALPAVHVDPHMTAPMEREHHHQQHQQPSFLNSQSGMAAEAMAFHNAMGHFFPKNQPLSSSNASSSSSSSAAADVSTPTDLDQFIAMGGEPLSHPAQQQQLPFSIDPLSAF